MLGATSIFRPNPSVKDKILNGVSRGVSAVAQLVEQEAKAGVAVATGDLRDSIRALPVEQDRDLAGAGNAITAVVEAGTDHAFFVEYGTGLRGMESAGAGPGPYDPNWPGMVAQPYMRPALDTVRGEALATMASEVSSEL